MAERLIRNHERKMHENADTRLNAAQRGFLALVAAASVISAGGAAVSWIENHKERDEQPIVETLTTAQIEEITIRLDNLEKAVCDKGAGAISGIFMMMGSRAPYDTLQECLDWVTENSRE